jgi:hypothetical protein
MQELDGPRDRFAKIKRELAILKWMVGVNLAGVAFLVIKSFA